MLGRDAGIIPKLMAAGAALLMLPGVAHANGYEDLHQSAQGLGTAYAVNGAGIEDISAIFSNPGSLTRFDGSWASGGVSVILPRDSFQNLAATAPISGAPVTGTPAVPTQFLGNTVGGNLFASHQLTPNLYAAIAFTVPWATKSDYPSTAVSRYTAENTNLRAYNLNPVLAVKLGHGLSLGGGPAIQYYTSDFSTAVDPTGGVAASPASDVTSRIKGNSLAIGFTAGLEWQADARTRIGLSYRSGVGHDFNGTVALTAGNPASLTLLASGIATATGQPLTSNTGGARFHINTPSLASAGIAFKATPSIDLYANATLVGWHLFRNTTITYSNGLPATVVDNNWHDSWYLAIGAAWRASAAWQLRTGIAHDQTPTQDNVRNPRAPNADRVYAGIGATYRRGANWKLDFAYNHCFFDNAVINLAGGDNLPRGTLYGISEIDANILMAQLTVNLGKVFSH